jgi:hypothetical protein
MFYIRCGTMVPVVPGTGPRLESMTLDAAHDRPQDARTLNPKFHILMFRGCAYAHFHRHDSRMVAASREAPTVSWERKVNRA